MATISASEDTQHTPCTSIQLEDSDEFFDSTPYQANMSKRRYRCSELQREDNSQSRVNKIKNIFEEVTSDLVPSSPSSRNVSQQANNFRPSVPSSSGRAIRLSVHKADSDYFVNSSEPICQATLPRPQPLHSHSTKHSSVAVSSSPLKSTRKSLSAGHNTPSRIPRPVRDLNTIKLTAGFTYGEDSDDEDVHSTHGVPLILPIRGQDTDIRQKTSTVSQWLQTVDSPALNENFNTTGKSARGRAGSSPLTAKNKENYRPQHGSMNRYIVEDRLSSGLVRPASTMTDPYRRNNSHISNQPNKEHSQHARGNDIPIIKRTPPTGLLLMPPRRIGQTPSTSIPSRNIDISRQVKSLYRKPKDQEIEGIRCHSSLSNKFVQEDILVDLSPSVNRDRRHRGLSKNGSPTMNQGPKNPSTNLEIADFILALEAHDREEEEQRGRNTYKI